MNMSHNQSGVITVQPSIGLLFPGFDLNLNNSSTTPIHQNSKDDIQVKNSIDHKTIIDNNVNVEYEPMDIDNNDTDVDDNFMDTDNIAAIVA